VESRFAKPRRTILTLIAFDGTVLLALSAAFVSITTFATVSESAGLATGAGCAVGAIALAAASWRRLPTVARGIALAAAGIALLSLLEILYRWR
jgi:hypothetical protein